MIRDEDLENLLTRKGGAQLLRISLATLDRLIAAGEIETIRVGGRDRGRVFMTRRGLLDYLNRNRRAAAKLGKGR